MVVAESLPPLPSPEDIASLIQRAQNKYVDSQMALFRIPINESELPPNQNPLISQLQVDGQITDSTTPLSLEKNKKYELDLVVPQQSFEEYVEITPVGNSPKTESLFASVFTTCGTLETSSFNLSASSRPQLLSPNGKDIPPCPSPTPKLFVVLRDSRGGQAWKTLSFTLQE